MKVTGDMVRAKIVKYRAPNMTLLAGDVFDNFMHRLVEYGTIQWRLHTPDSNLVVFSDYSSEDGELLPTQFCHTCQFTLDEQAVFTCSCDVSRAIKSVGGCVTGTDEMENIIPQSLTCMHCQVLARILPEALPMIERLPTQQPHSTALSRKVQQAVTSINLGVSELVKGIAQKYSVKSRTSDSCAFVHISYNIITCQDGECQSKLRNRRSKKLLLDMTRASELCPHLEAMRAQSEI